MLRNTFPVCFFMRLSLLALLGAQVQFQPLPTTFRGEELYHWNQLHMFGWWWNNMKSLNFDLVVWLGTLNLFLFVKCLFVCVYFLNEFSWCFLLRIAGRWINDQVRILEIVPQNHGILDPEIPCFNPRCNTRLSYKNHLRTNLLRSPWWKETHVCGDASQSCSSWRWSCLAVRTRCGEAWTSEVRGAIIF